MSRWAVLLAMATTFAFACGGSQTGRKTEKEKRTLPPVKPEALRAFDAGLRAMRLGGPEATSKAEERFRDAVQIDSNLWEAWHNLGVIASLEGNDKKAVAAFKSALEIQPAHDATLAARAESYRRLGQLKRARADYEKLLRMSPEDLESRVKLAAILREGSKFEDALEVLRDALRASGESAEVYVELGMVYLAQGRDELAELVLKKALSFDDKNPAVFNALALHAHAAGQSQLAFNRFDQATALDPNFVDARYNKASVLIDAGDYNRALGELDLILQKDPDDLEALVAKGVALRGLGKLDGARSVWSDVISRARRRTRPRDDSLYNLAILEIDFVMDDKKGIRALDRFLQESSRSHPKRADAEERKKVLGL